MGGSFVGVCVGYIVGCIVVGTLVVGTLVGTSVVGTIGTSVVGLTYTIHHIPPPKPTLFSNQLL